MLHTTSQAIKPAADAQTCPEWQHLQTQKWFRASVAALALNVLFEQDEQEREELYRMFEKLVDSMVDPRREAYMIYKSEEMEQWIRPTDEMD